MKHLNPKAKKLFFITNFIATFFMLIPTTLISLIFTYHSLGLAGMSTTNFTILFFVLFIAYICLVIFLARWYANLQWKNYKFDFTKDAYYQESGIIFKHSLFIPYDRMQSVDIRQGPLSRFFQLSTIIITTAGTTGYGQNSGPLQGEIPAIDEDEAKELRLYIIKLIRESDKANL